MAWIVRRRHNRRQLVGLRLPLAGETVPEDHPRIKTLIRKRLVRWEEPTAEPVAELSAPQALVAAPAPLPLPPPQKQQTGRKKKKRRQ